MSLAREVNQPELEREEDCYEEPATREDMPITIVEEKYSCKVYAAMTMTSDYGTVVGDNRNKQGLLDCLRDVRDAVDNTFDAIYKDADKQFVRAMASAQQRKLERSLRMQHPSTGTIGPARSPSTFQPPSLCQDCVLGVASLYWSFRNITPRSRVVCHSTDYTSHSTDCTSLSTDCQRLPDMHVLPDVVVLPDVDKTVFLARGERGIVGSEKTTSPREMPRSPEPEVAGQPRWSQHTGGPD